MRLPAKDTYKVHAPNGERTLCNAPPKLYGRHKVGSAVTCEKCLRMMRKINTKPVRLKDRKLLDAIKSQPCVACGDVPTDPAHVRSRGAGGPDERWNVMPPCREHHVVELPCGRITKISMDDAWIKTVFPNWRFSGGYVRVSRYIATEFGYAKEEYMVHRLILGARMGWQVDHINRDKLDNRRPNLRLCSAGQNSQNKAKASRATSKYRGVSYRPQASKKKPWMAYISKDRVRHDLGYFETEVEAARAYDEKAKDLWGEFAFQNLAEELRRNGGGDVT